MLACVAKHSVLYAVVREVLCCAVRACRSQSHLSRKRANGASFTPQFCQAVPAWIPSSFIAQPPREVADRTRSEMMRWLPLTGMGSKFQDRGVQVTQSGPRNSESSPPAFVVDWSTPLPTGQYGRSRRPAEGLGPPSRLYTRATGFRRLAAAHAKYHEPGLRLHFYVLEWKRFFFKWGSRPPCSIPWALSARELEL